MPELGAALLPIVIATTVVFELGGPFLTRMALEHSGEVGVVRVDSD